MAAAGSRRPLLCQDLHQRVLDLFEQGNYTDVCNLKDEVDVFVTVYKDKRSNADIVFLLGNAMLINKLNFEANISGSGRTRRVICQTFWGKLVGLQWDLVQR